MDISTLVESIGRLVDLTGVAVIVLGAGLVTVIAVRRLLGHVAPPDALSTGYRRGLGRTILLGLELLVAADIIRTVAVAPTLNGVVVLGVIVLVRTFLSFSLEVELYGRWPWQHPTEPTTSPTPFE